MTSRMNALLLLACILSFGTRQTLHSQQHTVLTFRGSNTATGLDVKLDSIQIHGIEKTLDTTLKGVQELIISTVTDLERPLAPLPQREFLSSPFGNPFSERTTFYLSTAGATSITLEVLDMLGKSLLRRTTLTEAGVHQFRFEGQGLDPGLYFLVATVGSKQLVTKMLKTDNGGTAKPEFVYEGPVSRDMAVSDGFCKAKATSDVYRCIGYAKGFVADTISASVERDTTYVFRLRPVNTAPDISTFVADTYDAVKGESVRYTIIVKDAEVNLSTVWIDFERDGVYDDSSSISGGDALTYFQKAFRTAGTYQAMARAMDRAGLMCERSLPTPVRVTIANTAPSISAFVASSYGVMTGDSVTYTVTLADPDGDLSKVWMDYDGDGVYDDSGSVSGGDVVIRYTKAFTTPGSYSARVRVVDVEGLTDEMPLSSPVIVTKRNTAPAISSFSAGSYSVRTSDTVRYELSLNDAEGNLSKAWIDFDGNGVYDDSTSVSGGVALLHFRRVFTTPGSYPAKAWVRDDQGLASEKYLPSPVIVTQATVPPKIFVIDPTSISIGNGITLTGEHFGGTRGSNAVYFKGGDVGAGNSYSLAAADYTSWADAEIVLKVPTGILVDGVVYVTVDGRTSNEVHFSFHQKPTLTTAAVSNIQIPTATSGGTIPFDGGAPVTIRGVCWSTAQSPTTADSKTSDGPGTGGFTSTLTGLDPNTTYYVRAYATNTVGTAYGNEVSFSTDEGQPPVLTTAIVFAITQTSAIGGGTITSSGSFPVSARGVCWSTAQSPTTADSKTTNGTGTGSYTSNLTGLTSDTKYYVRAYATNNAGTGYGDAVSFTTDTASAGGEVSIGTQMWTLQNLDVTTYRNGDPIPEVKDIAQWSTLTTGAWCYFNNDPAMGAIYGKLYNWYAVNDARGLAPAGWHVPTDAEWKTLEMYLGMTQAQADGSSYRGTTEGGKMKEAGTTHWSSPNTGAVNTSGFTALPGSIRLGTGSFGGAASGTSGVWWTSTEQSATSAWGRWLYYSGADVLRNFYNKHVGFSIRCVKD